MSETREAQVLRLEARFAPSSIDSDARTAELTWTTGASVKRRDFWTGEQWVEELEVSGKAVDLSRLNAGAPLLNSHSQWSLGDVIGVVEKAWLVDGEGRALVRFSERDEVAPIFRDVKDGIIRNVSVGYSVSEWKETKREDGTRLKRAVRWQPAEISLVPVPADASAQVRAADAPPAPGTLPTIPQESRMADPVTTAPASPAAPNPSPIDAEAVRAAAVEAERTRVSEIETIFTGTRSLVGDDADAIRANAIKAGHTPDQVRAALLDAVIKRGKALPETPQQTPQTSVGNSGDAPEAIRDAMADAIAVQIRGTYKPKTERFREYAGARPSDMVRSLMQARGVRDIPFNRVTLAERSFNSTSDFPLLLSSALNKVLLSDYELAMPTYRTFMGRKIFNDFKAHNFLRVGDFPSLAALAEGGQITLGTMSENREQVTLATYARGIRVTRQMLVNDDLGAFSDFSNMIGRRVVDFESATAFAVLTSGSGAGPNLADGNAVFTTGRGNRAASGGAIDVITLGTARQALRGRTSPDGLKLNLAPRYLLTGPAYETIAWQYTSAQFVPATAATANPFQGTYTPVVDANISGNNWYLFADPAVAPVYIYGFLAGSEGPQTRTYNPEASDGAVAIDVWLDFAAGAIDWRGGQFNAGA